MKKNVEFNDNDSAQFICSDLYQPLAWPDEYPCFIQIHPERIDLCLNEGDEIMNSDLIIICEYEIAVGRMCKIG